MGDRFAGQSVIEELLREQGTQTPRSRIARILGFTPLRDESRPWYLGAQGEIIVGAKLEKLPPEWNIFHALPVGKKDTDIDHLVVGPAGVFTINTKHHRGKVVWVADRSFMISGQTKSYIPKAEAETAIVKKLTDQHYPGVSSVRPIIAVVGAKQLTIRKEPRQVKVIDANQLTRWLTKQPQVLASSGVAELVALFDRPDAWRVTELPVGDLLGRYKTLEAEVRSARKVRGLWSLVGAGALFLFGTLVAHLAPAIVGLMAGLGR